jgi:hypothetical protein
MKRERAIWGCFWALLAGVTLAATGCKTGAKQGGEGTSTGLPYRPPGTPTFTDLPPSFRTFPAAQPLNK